MMPGPTRHVIAVGLLALLGGCATLPAPAPGSTSAAAAAATTRANPEPPTPAPTPASDPLLVEQDKESQERERRLGQLASSPQALPAGEQGYYLDVLYAQLRQLLGPAAEVIRSSGAIRVVLPPQVSFEVASASLAPAAEAVLAPILQPLADYRSLLISVHGHSDASGPAEVNRRLSGQRAVTVARRLVALGVPTRQVMAVGFGAEQPKADNATAEGRQINRRVELLLQAISAPSP